VQSRSKRPSAAKALATLAGVFALLAGATTAAQAEYNQKGNVLATFNGHLAPVKLPRIGTAPVTMEIDGNIKTTDGSQPPALQTVAIAINHHGSLFYKGLPTCPKSKLTNTTSSVALKRCRAALIGTGHFGAQVVFPQASPFPALGKILSFNSVTPNGTHMILAHIFGRVPLATTYILPFKIQRIPGGGTYGTSLDATFPEVSDNWGYVTHFDLTLKRRFLYRGQKRSFLNAGCPIPKGYGQALFPLAKATYGFKGGLDISNTLARSCQARG
jgi:hypothetical protein